MLTADEALQTAWSTQVLPDVEFETGLGSSRPSSRERPPIALALYQAGRRACVRLRGSDYEGEEPQPATLLSDDVKEGFAAVAEKRKPVFRPTGRP